MTKKADTWMPLYVGEYLADTTHLNTEQHGAYCLMLMAAWKRGGKLPNDDQQLASITKMSAAKWRANRHVLAEFFLIDGASLSHKRVTEEREKAQSISDKKAVTGKAGATKRWQRDGESDGKPMANAMANPMANASQTDAPTRVFSPSPSHVPTELNQEADASLSPDDRRPALELVGVSECPPADAGARPHRKPSRPPPAARPDRRNPAAEGGGGGPGAVAMRQRWRWLLTAKREDGTRYARDAEEALEWFDRFFHRVAGSDFLTGRNGKWAGCTLAWLMKREKFTAVIDGRYDHGRQSA